MIDIGDAAAWFAAPRNLTAAGEPAFFAAVAAHVKVAAPSLFDDPRNLTSGTGRTGTSMDGQNLTKKF